MKLDYKYILNQTTLVGNGDCGHSFYDSIIEVCRLLFKNVTYKDGLITSKTKLGKLRIICSFNEPKVYIDISNCWCQESQLNSSNIRFLNYESCCNFLDGVKDLEDIIVKNEG